MQFKDRLRDLRIAADLTQTDLAKRIGVSTSTISMYELGNREPNLEILDALCDFFNVDTNYILGKSDKTTVFPSDIPNLNKRSAGRPLSTYERQILEPFNKLNDEGKDKVIDYTYDLLESDKYIEEETVTYIGKAAAGNGYNYLDNIEIEQTIAKKERPKYDFIIKVQGDSMEPKIQNNALAFVKISTDFDSGKIYVVDNDGAVFIKKVYFEQDRIILKSVNSKYKDIEITFSEGFRVLGEVVDWE